MIYGADMCAVVDKKSGSHLGATGKERFDVDVGVVNFEVVVTEPTGHTDGSQHPCL